MLFLLLFAFQQTAPPPNDVVAGTVLSERDQRPIPHAAVTLSDNESSTIVVSTTSDDTGHYRLPPVPAGKYSLTAAAPGFIAAAYLHHGEFSTAIVTGAGLPTGTLILTLTPAATLSGTVTDDADPIEFASVHLFREDLTTAERIVSYRTIPAPQGAFEFLNLPPGRYYLFASARPWYSVPVPLTARDAHSNYRAAIDPTVQVLYPDTFYPDTTDAAAAAPLTLHPGEQLTAALRMHPQQPVTLTVRLPPGPPPAPPTVPDEVRGPVINLQLSHMVFGEEQTFGNDQSAQFDNGDGTITLTGILPGRYFLSQGGPDDGILARVGELDLNNSTSTFDLPASTGHATVAVTVHGVAKSSGDGSSSAVTLQSTASLVQPTHGLDDRNQTVFQSVPPGDYRFHVNGSRNSNANYSFNVTSVIVNDRPAPDKQLHLNAAGKVSVVLTVSQTQVEVHGFARSEGKPAPGAMVVLVPAGPDAHEDLYRRDQADLDGSFVFNGVAPGKYLLVAIEDGWPLRWDDPATLVPYLLHAVPISIPTTAPSTLSLSTPVQTQPR